MKSKIKISAVKPKITRTPNLKGQKYVQIFKKGEQQLQLKSGLLIKDKVTGRIYKNDNNDAAIILRSLKENGLEGEYSVEQVWKGYNRWLDTLSKNPDNLYDKTIESVKLLTTTAQKLVRYIGSGAFLGNKVDVGKSNMFRIISHYPSKFEEAVKECGGDPTKWNTYIFSSEDPWVYGVEVNGHHIKIKVDATMYSDSAKDFAVEVVD